MNINGSGLSKMLHSNMRKTQTSLQKSIGKLASGQRIRSAANDPPGLSISQ